MSAVAGPSLDGAHAPATNNPFDHDAQEFGKILQLRDEIFAGSHPRLRVPAHAIRKVAKTPVPEFVPPLAVIPLPPKPVIEQPSVTLPGLQLNSGPSHVSPRPPPPTDIATPNGIPAHPKAPPRQATASGIDPIFLTKSDDLVRAETQLARQRLEKQLREQFEQKKIDARRRPHPEEVQPELNPAVVLAKVLEMAQPVTTAKSPGVPEGASASDSFDENSFYSSKAPDSTPEEGALSESPPVPEHQVQSTVMHDLDADGLAEQRPTQTQQNNEPDSPYTRLPRPEHGAPAGNRPLYGSRLDRAQPQSAAATDLTAMEIDDDDDDEYEPPEPAESYAPINNGSTFDARDPRSRPLRRYSGTEQNGKRYGSPSESDMRIVRNHITSPFAPQPSRVSPLAVAKEAPLLQTARSRRDRMRQQDGRPISLRASPDYSINPTHVSQQAQPPPSRKKRKVEKKTNPNRRASGRHAAGSPVPLIKDEPVSPPPFHDVQPLGSARQRIISDSRPILIDDPPTQEVRYVPVPDRYVSPAPRQILYEEVPLPRSEPRTYSRAGPHAISRDEQDLRKVASMHNMRIEQPREYADPPYVTPTRVRTPSYTVVETTSRAEEPRYYAEPQPAYERPPLREERAIRSPPPVYREAEPEIRYQPMAPPPQQQKRIVVDQYGNRFYEIINTPRASVAPRSTRPLEVEAYDNGGYAGHRATSVYAEAPPEKRFLSEMPPPPVQYRRLAEVPRSPIIESRPSMREQLEPSRLSRAPSVQVVEYPPRQPIYLDERELREPPTRMASARPAPSRYADMQPGEVVPRVQSVRPVGGREGSVFFDDRQPLRREYMPVPVEQPMYRRIVEPQQQYYDVPDRHDGMMLDAPDEGQRRVSQRYP